MAGGVGAKGNEGVAGQHRQTKNSIGYVEVAYAKQKKALTYTSLVNKAGQDRCADESPAVQAAASTTRKGKAPAYYVILTEPDG